MATSAFEAIETKRLTGTETFKGVCPSEAISVHDFWSWAYSDLVSNTTRGVLAEFIVASALNIHREVVRNPWMDWDLVTADGTRVEVKSAAFLQSWRQERLSTAIFSIAQSSSLDSGISDRDLIKRRADVYVFALLAHKDKTTLNPLDLSQWEFFVVPVGFLDQRKRSQLTITLPSLIKAGFPALRFEEIAGAIPAALTPP